MCLLGSIYQFTHLHKVNGYILTVKKPILCYTILNHSTRKHQVFNKLLFINTIRIATKEEIKSQLCISVNDYSRLNSIYMYPVLCCRDRCNNQRPSSALT